MYDACLHHHTQCKIKRVDIDGIGGLPSNPKFYQWHTLSPPSLPDSFFGISRFSLPPHLHFFIYHFFNNLTIDPTLSLSLIFHTNKQTPPPSYIYFKPQLPLPIPSTTPAALRQTWQQYFPQYRPPLPY